MRVNRNLAGDRNEDGLRILVLLIISVACSFLTVTRLICIEEGMVLCFILSLYTKAFR